MQSLSKLIESSNFGSEIMDRVVDFALEELASKTNNLSMNERISFLNSIGYPDDKIALSILKEVLEVGIKVDVGEPVKTSCHSEAFSGVVDGVYGEYVAVLDDDDFPWQIAMTDIVSFDMSGLARQDQAKHY